MYYSLLFGAVAWRIARLQTRMKSKGRLAKISCHMCLFGKNPSHTLPDADRCRDPNASGAFQADASPARKAHHAERGDPYEADLDLSDLFFHLFPAILLVLKLIRDRSG